MQLQDDAGPRGGRAPSGRRRRRRRRRARARRRPPPRGRARRRRSPPPPPQTCGGARPQRRPTHLQRRVAVESARRRPAELVALEPRRERAPAVLGVRRAAGGLAEGERQVLGRAGAAQPARSTPRHRPLVRPHHLRRAALRHAVERRRRRASPSSVARSSAGRFWSSTTTCCELRACAPPAFAACLDLFCSSYERRVCAPSDAASADLPEQGGPERTTSLAVSGVACIASCARALAACRELDRELHRRALAR